VILSTIGHAYGTYGSNWDAYDRLFYIFDGCCKVLGVQHTEVGGTISRRLTTDDIRDMRRKGISPKDILNGFPTRSELMSRNEWRPEYHSFAFAVEESYGATEFGEDW